MRFVDKEHGSVSPRFVNAVFQVSGSGVIRAHRRGIDDDRLADIQHAEILIDLRNNVRHLVLADARVADEDD